MNKFGGMKHQLGLKHWTGKNSAGQSMVEMAIALPILLIMLIGVFEVGWALRGYLTLANVNREATRFAARGIYLDFDQIDCGTDCGAETEIGYQRVVSHTLRSLSNQLPLALTTENPTGSQIISYYNLEPDGFNCLGDGDCRPFDCSRFAYENRDEADFVAAEPSQLPRVQIGESTVLHEDLSVRRRVEAADHIEEGRLAGA